MKVKAFITQISKIEWTAAHHHMFLALQVLNSYFVPAVFRTKHTSSNRNKYVPFEPNYGETDVNLSGRFENLFGEHRVQVFWF